MKQVKLITSITAAIVSCSLMFGGGAAMAYSYQVQPGDSLYQIAGNHKITVEALKQANGLSGSLIWVGQILTVPVAYDSHQVRRGESLYIIARQYGCSVEALKRINGLKSNLIRTGTILQIPAVSQEKTAKVTSRGGSYQRTYTQDEWDMLAQVVYGEARGEIYNGQVAVAAVVLNRLRHQSFPDTLQGVIFQKNAFTCVSDGQYYLEPDNTAYRAAMEAMEGHDPTNGCLYYWNPVTATSRWIGTREIETTIGNHVFGN